MAVRTPAPESLLLPPRREKVDEVIALRTRSLTVVLEGLQDPFNMAAVVRTSEAMGIQELHVIEAPGIPFAPAVGVTQGCEKWVDVQRHAGFAACRSALAERGFRLWVSAPGPNSRSLFDLTFEGRVALVFGNERTGVSSEARALADAMFWIPMRGFTQSLNISAAVSAVLTRAIGWRVEHGQAEGDLAEADAAEVRERFYTLSVKQRRRIYRKS